MLTAINGLLYNLQNILLRQSSPTLFSHSYLHNTEQLLNNYFDDKGKYKIM